MDIGGLSPDMDTPLQMTTEIEEQSELKAFGAETTEMKAAPRNKVSIRWFGSGAHRESSGNSTKRPNTRLSELTVTKLPTSFASYPTVSGR